MIEIGAAFAHSLPGRPVADWEPLPTHLREVASLAASFAGVFGWAGIARMAGLLHDVGKCSAEFLAYIRRSSDGDGSGRGPDHSTAGARVAAEAYPSTLGHILAAAIAAHHAGLTEPCAGLTQASETFGRNRLCAYIERTRGPPL